MADAVHAVSVAGPDALALVSAVTTLPPGTRPPAGGQEALVLDRQGHIQFGFVILDCGGEDSWLLLTDAPAEALAGFLDARRFRRRLEAAPRPDLRVLIVPEPLGPEARALALAEAVDRWPGSAGRPGGIGPKYAPGPEHPGNAWTGATLYPYPAGGKLPELLEQGGYRCVDAAAVEALRIAAWRPLATREAADGKTLPHELDWLRTSTPLNSGCYPGQETVAKIVNTGRPPRRLAFLHLDGSEAALPDPGAAVRLAAAGEGAPVGHVTSAAVHHELGPVALALVKRSIPEDAPLTADAEDAAGGRVAASQTPIVPASGESDSRPARRAPPRRTRG
ncbi:MAG: hypothetical protein LBL01_03655 [Bifidobacteriaceae bacterium]|jgi:folate-binding protein YgfZ|nr:hypothetical protein [Bifidobacteriaceae bacterium]